MVSRAVNQTGEPIARGHLRTPTQEELANWNEFDNPVIMTQKKVVGDEGMTGDYAAMGSGFKKQATPPATTRGWVWFRSDDRRGMPVLVRS